VFVLKKIYGQPREIAAQLAIRLNTVHSISKAKAVPNMREKGERGQKLKLVSTTKVREQ
jgi:hypothetical protein